MATVTSTSATPTPTPKPSAQSITSAAAQSLLTSLGSGSGVDTSSLVNSLVEAQFAAKRAQLTSRYDTLTAQISGASSLKSTITDFTNALSSLVKGGTLASAPVSSNTNVLTASAIPGTRLSGLSTTVSVSQLATAQTAVSSKIANPATTFGTGTLTLQLGKATFNSSGAMSGFTAGSSAAVSISIDSSNNTVAGIAAAINAANAGVTATVVTDADGGAFLSLKGETGTDQAFTLRSSNSGNALAQFDVRPPVNGRTVKTTISTQAMNAKVKVDGVAVERAGNEITDLVPGVKLNLTQLGTATLTANRPTSALSAAVTDFVDTYNQVLAAVKEQTDPITGNLRSDPAAKALLRSLQGMSSRTLLPNAAAGTPATLAAIGVRTNRDGTLEINDDALAAALRDTPDAVEQMFAPSSVSATGLLSALQSIQLTSTSTVYGLGASTTRYTSQRSDVGEQQEKVDDQASRMLTRLTQQFASMNSRVNAYKATQSFMQQQVDSWTKSDS